MNSTDIKQLRQRGLFLEGKLKSFLLAINILLLSSFSAFAQSNGQTVKGLVIDQQSEMPLIGATIIIITDESGLGSTSDIDGEFQIASVPLGRQSFEVSYLGYESVIVPNVEVTAGKEVYLNIAMQESLVSLDEVVITAEIDKDRSINEMATVSSRQFSMEEVNRFSGGRSDVGRLAGNFAGVSTADDSRNDIVIRGNSPTGLLWRLEGIPIPSPNHFSTVGTTGGPVSALNPNLLKNSDFLTSAFPSEYGNALSGVFDLGFRSGNKDKNEYSFQLGAITGFEGMVEGPMFKENGGSFLVAGRYSFVGIAQAIGLDIGTNAVPNYYDLSFKLDFGRSALGNVILFGVGGRSDIEFLREEVDETDLFAADDEDSGADSQFGVVGLKHNLMIGDNSYLRTVIAASGNSVAFQRDRYYQFDTEVKAPFVVGDDALGRYSVSSYFNTKHSSRFTSRIGFLAERVSASLSFQSAELADDIDSNGIYELREIYDFQESTLLLQPFAQGSYRINEKLTFNLGVHGMYYDLNGQTAIEPRAALQWQLAEKHKINLGFGLHNQTQPIPIQITSKVNMETSETTYPNRELDFSKSNQFVLGHDFRINKSWRSKIELYYQDVSNVPVEREASSFSVLNVGADFGFPVDKDDLVNEGTGRNMGLELTLEKFFDKGYYTLLTGSIFDSKYEGSDGIERNTAFNNKYVLNALAGKEFKWGGNGQHRITFDTKITNAGGRYYTPVDLPASMVDGVQMFQEEIAFSEQHSSYFRWDVKMGIKMNNEKRGFSQALYFDIQNVTNSENIFAKRYNRQTNEVNDVFQIGFFPNFMYKIEF